MREERQALSLARPLDSVAALEIGELDRGQFADQRARPVSEDRGDGDMIGDPEP